MAVLKIYSGGIVLSCGRPLLKKNISLPAGFDSNNRAGAI
jgi:hypothetical protein